MKKITWKLLLLVAVVGLSVTGCKKEEVTEESTEEITEVEELVIEVEEETEEEVEEIVGNINLLTGIADLSDEAIGMRPVAVMVSNVEAAMPQYGTSDADIIIEMPVEGGLTRFMALYADYTQVPNICSVRSCRDYFPSVSEGFDAFYIHWGIDSSVQDHYDALDLDSLNGMYNDGGIFDRDSDRVSSGYATEHTSMIYGGETLVAAIEDAGFRTELSEDKTDTFFNFNASDTPVAASDTACTSVLVDFGAATAGFTYDAEEMVYYKQFNGDDQVDGVTGIQLSFTNLFILETSITARTDTTGGRVAVECYGVSDQVGYYVSNGAVQEIRWSKADEFSGLIFCDLDGEELVINAGKSYIAFNYADETVFE